MAANNKSNELKLNNFPPLTFQLDDALSNSKI